MNAISPDMRKAALIRQDPGRPHVHPRSTTEGQELIMSQTFADSPVSEAGKAAIARSVADVFGECLQVLQRADQVLKAAGIPRPREADELREFLRPLQAVQS